MERQDPSRTAIVITGPTATGKSELAVDVAERLGGEIISADSRQVYRFTDIGTAKPPPALRARVPHHGLDRLEPDERFSAGGFARESRGWIAEIRRRGHVPIIAGGSGLFIRALLDPLAPEPRVEPDRREDVRRYLAGFSVDRLRAWLGRLDPARANQLREEGGPQRLARSLEVVLLSGRGHSWWLRRPPEAPPVKALLFCLRLDREALYRRVDHRFDQMMSDGLLDEVRSLLDRYPIESPGLNSVGYAEIMAYLRSDLTLEAAVEQAKRSTRRFARRQVTWFRHQMPEDTVWLDADSPREQLVDAIARRWEEERPIPDTGRRPPSSLASDE